MAKMRRFNQEDWDCYAGAERFDSGNAPMIAELTKDGEDYIGIASRCGIEFDIEIEDDTVSYFKPLSLPEPLMIEVLKWFVEHPEEICDSWFV